VLLRTLLVFLFFVFLARAVGRLLGGIARGMGSRDRGPQSRVRPPQGVKMAKCPVCGTYVVPGRSISAARGGRTVYYCSEQCRDAA
jgi:hypothetical protein